MELKNVYSKMFYWMFIGLLVTFLTGYTIANNFSMLEFVFSIPWIIYVIIELVLVIVLSSRLHKMSSMTAKICFVLYSFVTGLTFSTIFIAYQLSSIIYVFGITSLLFGIFALLGHFTKMDLSKIGTFLLMGLFGIIICYIINYFLGSTQFDLIITIIGIVIFLGYTAYDIQKVKMLMNTFPEDNLSIYGALELYLDFINLFLDLIKLFGKRND